MSQSSLISTESWTKFVHISPSFDNKVNSSTIPHFLSVTHSSLHHHHHHQNDELFRCCTSSVNSKKQKKSTSSHSKKRTSNHLANSNDISSPAGPSLTTTTPATTVPSAETVKSFLQTNPDFLDAYVVTSGHVSADKIEDWASKVRHSSSSPPPSSRNTIPTASSSSPPLVRLPQTPNSSSFLRHSSSSTTNPRTPTPPIESTRANDSSSLPPTTTTGAQTTTTSNTTNNSMTRLRELSDKRRLLNELTSDIHQNVSKAQILYELSRCISQSISADGFNLYLVDETGKSMRVFTNENDSEEAENIVPVRIEPGHCIAGYVGYAKETVRINSLSDLDMDKYPDGLYMKEENVSCVMAHPLLNSRGHLLGVVEFFRRNPSTPFSADDEELYQTMIRERRLNDFLLAVTKSIFQELVSMETVMLKIMSYAKKLVNADRASLFLVDYRTKELYARIFDIGREEDVITESTAQSGSATSLVPDKDKEIRFPMDKGIAGTVATTGKTLNIADAYSDPRFHRGIDEKTGYRTKNILCMPISIQSNVIGVVQMVNKKSGHFTKADEESFETFAVYCGLALHHASLYDRIRRSEQKYKVAIEVLAYHASCTDDEYERMKVYPLPEKIENIERFDFSPWDVDNDMKPSYVMYMFLDLANQEVSNANRFDTECVMRFILTVRKNYRNVPYHNWSHAFSVAHAMYTVIKSTRHRFTPNQCLALFVACICHDLDHRGKTNMFMVKTASPLASIYSTSTMERHHFNQTVIILQTESHNIFKHFSSKEYRQILDDIRHCILATDLALFFQNRPKLEELIATNKFDWDVPEHMQLATAVTMTACDLCSSYKRWEVQRSNVSIIMEEFYQQGDEEKRRGQVPVSLNDRLLAHELPKNQVNFINMICLPCYKVLAQVLPDTQPMLDGAKSNLQKWQELADIEEAKRKEKQSSEQQQQQQTS